MIICKNTKETLEQFKNRLIQEIATGRLSAEDAFDAYEEAVQKEECSQQVELLLFGKYLFSREEQIVDILGDDQHDCLRSVCSKYNLTPKRIVFKKDDIENYNEELDFVDNICLAYKYYNFTNA